MIQSGLVSVTFRQLAPEQIINLAARAGLSGIEWSGDVHVPHGDIQKARVVHRMTIEAGIKIVSYGSYYIVAESNKREGLTFENVLETAIALGAPNIRVWAGDRSSAKADQNYRQQVCDETRIIADKAKSAGITVAYEFHAQSLTDTTESAKQLLENVAHSNVFAYWQPIVKTGLDENLVSLEMIMPWINNVHVFYWWPDTASRHLLSEGTDNWKCYLQKLASSDKNHFALLEFVKDDKIENFLKDAQTLKGWLLK